MILTRRKERHVRFRYETGEIRKTWWNNISYIPQAAQSVLNPITRLAQSVPGLHSGIAEEERDETADARTLRGQYLEGTRTFRPTCWSAYPFQLSGGMRQRVIIALATFMSPNVVLADEPTTALDVVVQRGILMMLMRLQQPAQEHPGASSATTWAFTTRSPKRMGIMYSGSFVELGNTEDIFNDPIHPYTTMLIGALPRVGDKSQKAGIPGRPPALTNPPPGCRFAPRCPLAKDICRRECPAFTRGAPGTLCGLPYAGQGGDLNGEQPA